MAIAAPTPPNIAEAAALIRAGRLVAMPTETVYGLAADATNGRAVAGIFEAKGRPRFNPLIVHVADLDHAHRLADFSPTAISLAERFWPGPLTLVLVRRAESGIADLVTAGLATIAIRCPAHAIARALIAAADRPLAAPSANRSGHVSATTAAHVAADLGDRVAMVLDGGPTAHGLESTILDATGADIAVLRPGAVPVDQIERTLGRGMRRVLDGGEAPTSPGQLPSHYAPRAALRLGALSVNDGEALLAFGPDAPPTRGPAINLSPAGDLVEAAQNLFAALRSLDASGTSTIAVMAIPNEGLGEAINDRLRRAAAPRR